jgi:hypothetical protein
LWDDAENENRAAWPDTSHYALNDINYALRPQQAITLAGEVNHINHLFSKEI